MAEILQSLRISLGVSLAATRSILGDLNIYLIFFPFFSLILAEILELFPDWLDEIDDWKLEVFHEKL